MGMNTSSAAKKRSNTVIVLMAVLILTLTPLPAIATDSKVWRIGVVKIVSHDALDTDENGFEAGLANAGFKEGVNVVYERYNAHGEPTNADAIARKLATGGYDLIHSIATPTTQAVLKVVTNTPIVFSAVTDPVAAGIVPRNSLPGSKTGTHVTGVSDKWPVQLQMRTYLKLMPQATIWGAIYNLDLKYEVQHLPGGDVLRWNELQTPE